MFAKLFVLDVLYVGQSAHSAGSAVYNGIHSQTYCESAQPDIVVRKPGLNHFQECGSRSLCGSSNETSFSASARQTVVSSAIYRVQQWCVRLHTFF